MSRQTNNNKDDTSPVQTSTTALLPAEDALIAAFKLTNPQKEWIKEEYYASFLEKKTNRGTQVGPTGKTFAHTTVADNFVSKFWSEWPENKKQAYREKLNKVIYNFFNNTFKGDNEARKTNEAAKAPPSKPKKISAQNEWSKKNQRTVNEAVDQYLDNTPGSLRNIGTVRSVLCREFANLPANEQQFWQAHAEAERNKAKVQLPFKGEDLILYLSDWRDRLNRLVLEGRKCAGLSIASLICWEGTASNGMPISNIDSFTSEDISDYIDSPEFSESYAGFTNWFQSAKGVKVKGSDPLPAVYPDPDNHNRPVMPSHENAKVAVYRQHNRDFVNAEWSFHGGVGPTPWKVLSDAFRQGELDLWVKGWPKDLEFSDPGTQSLALSQQVYDVLRGRQDGLPPNDQFRFIRVLAGPNPPPSHCSASHISKRNHKGHVVHVLEYDKPVDRPQCERGVAYPPRSWEYFYFQMEKRNLDHWLGLASVSNASVMVLITPDVFALVQTLLHPVDPDLCARAIQTLEHVNLMEKHGPHTTTEGIWGAKGAIAPVPILIPSVKPSSPAACLASQIINFWCPDSYGMSTYMAKAKGHPDHATLEYFFSWLESLLDSSFIHKPSDTIQGGDGGIAWVIVPLLQLLLNSAVSVRGVKPPSPAPASLNLDRLGQGEFYKLCDFFKIWSDLCEKSLRILAQSSNERLHVADTEAAESDVELDEVRLAAESDPGGDEGVTIPAPTSKAKGKGCAMPRRSAQISFAELDAEESTSSSSETPAPVVLDHTLFEPSPARVALIDFESRKQIFGQFASQPMVPTPTGTPQALIKETVALFEEADTAVKAWYDLDAMNGTAYPYECILHAQKLAERAVGAKRPLTVGALLHRFHMNRCRALWPQFKQRHMAVLLAGRKLSELYKAVSEALEANLSRAITKKLDEYLTRIEAKVYLCRSIFEPLHQMQQVSTRFANEARDAWDLDIFKMSSNDLLALSHVLAEWRDATYSNMRDFRNFIAGTWAELNFHDIEPLPKKLIFCFGGPPGEIYSSEALITLRDYPKGTLVRTPSLPPSLSPAQEHPDTDGLNNASLPTFPPPEQPASSTTTSGDQPLPPPAEQRTMVTGTDADHDQVHETVGALMREDRDASGPEDVMRGMESGTGDNNPPLVGERTDVPIDDDLDGGLSAIDNPNNQVGGEDTNMANTIIPPEGPSVAEESGSGQTAAPEPKPIGTVVRQTRASKRKADAPEGSGPSANTQAVKSRGKKRLRGAK